MHIKSWRKEHPIEEGMLTDMDISVRISSEPQVEMTFVSNDHGLFDTGYGFRMVWVWIITMVVCGIIIVFFPLRMELVAITGLIGLLTSLFYQGKEETNRMTMVDHYDLPAQRANRREYTGTEPHHEWLEKGVLPDGRVGTVEVGDKVMSWRRRGFKEVN